MNDKPKPQRNFMMKPEDQPPFAGFMGMKITHISPERVTAELLVTEELTNRNGVLHGGALMALADNLGGTAACCNLPETGGSTATIESKTNFFAADPGRRRGEGRMHAAAPRPHHHGLADPHHPRRRQARRDRDADTTDDDQTGSLSKWTCVRRWRSRRASRWR